MKQNDMYIFFKAKRAVLVVPTKCVKMLLLLTQTAIQQTEEVGAVKF